MSELDTKPSFLIGFSNSYIYLPDRFFSRVNPTRVRAPRLVKFNTELASALGIDLHGFTPGEAAEVFSGNQIAAGSQPLAMAYAGHQFGHFVPQLGDGRANLLGEIVAKNGLRYDIQLKGSGPTPFSRNGDGRAAIGPVLREYIISEAMARLGVPTTRALAAVTTGQPVYREELQPGAVLTRVAASHLRVGTFQYFAAREDKEGIRTLADYAIGRHYPELAGVTRRYRLLLEGVIKRQASLVAQWMLFGFIHGVMNTDNTSISGETIDYGPCAFMEAYNPETVFSSIDRQGRYAYLNQPNAMHWNLARLAEALLPLLVEEEGGDDAGLESAYEALRGFGPQYESALYAGFRRKLGLVTELDGDRELIDDLLKRMTENKADHTLTFRRLYEVAAGVSGAGVRVLFADPAAFDLWEALWRRRVSAESNSKEERAERMRLANPVFIPRNHLVEEALQAASESEDFGPFEELLKVLANPFNEQRGRERYALPAKPEEAVQRTFCGT